ncbi:hypothetical protein MNBD_GAMMA23-2509 [hydrothermal vent metagenome]|uniref:OmpA-like domain-containing protein n=1 Tax=hydrothermal vent metagenome TaxID=652676 RepID=A0A3B1AEH6_9ZZZZ
MYRKFTVYIRIILLATLVLGTASCGLKFGADARQAAENADKNQQQSKFVDVDNTQAEPNVKPVISLDGSADKSSAAPAKKAARYVRTGKNRRLKVASPQSSPDTENVVAKDKPIKKGGSATVAEQAKGTPHNHIEKRGSLHQKVTSNIRSVHQKVMSKIKGNQPVKQKVLYPRVQLYGAKITQSKWVLTSTELECSISQPIPRLGKARFRYNPVQFLKFIFEVNHPIARNLHAKDKRYSRPLLTDHYPYPDVGAKLESIPPNWKPFAIKKLLGFIPFKEGYEPFVLPHRQRLAMSAAQENKRKTSKGQQQIASISKTYLPEIWPDRLMYELQEGMSVRLTYRDWTDATQDIITTISPINFAKIKRKFEKCISTRPKYNFKALQKTVLYFNKNQRNLSKKLRNQLRNMVKFVKLDEEIKKVMIKSYTDSMGFKRVNRNAAKVQAQAIKRYMKKLGMQVPITAIGIGEGPYVASNRSSAGRAKNRRSIITLIK